MKTCFLSILRSDHDVKIEVSCDNPGLGYVVADVPQFDDAGQNRVGTLYRAEDRIPLTMIEEEEAREHLTEANRVEPEWERDDWMSGRDMDAVANTYFGNRLK